MLRKWLILTIQALIRSGSAHIYLCCSRHFTWNKSIC